MTAIFILVHVNWYRIGIELAALNGPRVPIYFKNHQLEMNHSINMSQIMKL